jgi:hypothetical protein
MPESPLKGSLNEQAICVSCGFCCDGTLFLHAHLDPGERGNLPEKIEQNSYTKGEKDYFRLPCHYFYNKCTIYNSRRANICSSYRCQLLKDFAGGKLTQNDALFIVKEALNMRTDLMKQYKRVTGKSNDICFRQLQVDLGEILKSLPEEEPVNHDYEMLQAKCNIFEALLIKHIRSANDFENIMLTTPPGKNDSI